MCGGFGVGSFAVDLGDEDVGLGGEIGGQLLPDGGEGLAVCSGVSYGLLTRLGLGRHTSAPWGGEGNKHVLILPNLLLEGLVIQVDDLTG